MHNLGSRHWKFLPWEKAYFDRIEEAVASASEEGSEVKKDEAGATKQARLVALTRSQEEALCL